MLFLRRILFFASKGTTDKRKAKRYPVGPGFPVKVFVSLARVDDRGQPVDSPGGKGQDWGGLLVNVSAGGVSVALARSASAKRGDPCRLRLALNHRTIEIEGKVAHFRSDNRGAVCGIELDFGQPELRRAYGQLLESVAIGGSFAPFPVSPAKRAEQEFHQEMYRSTKGSVLTIWRRTPRSPPMAFDITVGDYSLRWDTMSGRHIIRASGDSRQPNPGEREDIHQLTKLVLPNLPEAVPADVREFFRRYLEQ